LKIEIQKEKIINKNDRAGDNDKKDREE